MKDKQKNQPPSPPRFQKLILKRTKEILKKAKMIILKNPKMILKSPKGILKSPKEILKNTKAILKKPLKKTLKNQYSRQRGKPHR